MTEWMIRVVDVRQRLLERPYVRAKIEPWLAGHHIGIVCGPSTVFQAKGVLLGEWAFRVVDAKRRSRVEVHLLLGDVIPQGGFRLLTLDQVETVPVRRHLRPAPDLTPPSGIPTLRRNSPYDMISGSLPYAGDTR